MVNHTIRKLDYGLCVGESKRIRMKNLRDEFSDEEKQHLSYLGSMLGKRLGLTPAESTKHQENK